MADHIDPNSPMYDRTNVKGLLLRDFQCLITGQYVVEIETHGMRLLSAFMQRKEIARFIQTHHNGEWPTGNEIDYLIFEKKYPEKIGDFPLKNTTPKDMNERLSIFRKIPCEWYATGMSGSNRVYFPRKGQRLDTGLNCEEGDFIPPLLRTIARIDEKRANLNFTREEWWEGEKPFEKEFHFNDILARPLILGYSAGKFNLREQNII